jgi:hypothetical protein
MATSKKFITTSLIFLTLSLLGVNPSHASSTVGTNKISNTPKAATDTFGDPLFDKRNNKAVDPWLITFAGYLAYADDMVSSGKYDFNTLIQDYYNIRGNLYVKRYSYLNILTPEEQNLGVKQSDPKPSEFLDLWSEKTKLWYCYADKRYLDNKPYTGQPLRHRLILQSCEQFLSSHTLKLPSILKSSYVKSTFDNYSITTNLPTTTLPAPLNNPLAQSNLQGSNIIFSGVINDNSNITDLKIIPTTPDSDKYGIIFTPSGNFTPTLSPDGKSYNLSISLSDVISQYKAKNSLIDDPICSKNTNNQIWRLKFIISYKDGSTQQGYFDTYIVRNGCLN